MKVYPSPNPRLKFFGDNGKPLAGGYLMTFIAGTSIPVATFNGSGTANPVVIPLDSRGEADVRLRPDMAYKFILCRYDHSVIWEADNIKAGGEGSTDVGVVEGEGIKVVPYHSDVTGHTTYEISLSDETKELLAMGEEAYGRRGRVAVDEADVPTAEFLGDKINAGDNVEIATKVNPRTGSKQLVIKAKGGSGTKWYSVGWSMGQGFGSSTAIGLNSDDVTYADKLQRDGWLFTITLSGDEMRVTATTDDERNVARQAEAIGSRTDGAYWFYDYNSYSGDVTQKKMHIYLTDYNVQFQSYEVGETVLDDVHVEGNVAKELERLLVPVPSAGGNVLRSTAWGDAEWSDGGAGDGKVAVAEGITPDYLDKVVEVESPITKTITDDGKLYFRWDGTSNNTLTLISNMPLPCATEKYSCTEGSVFGRGSHYGMTLNAFSISNYFNLAPTDVFAIVTTNTVADISLLRIALYKWDVDENVLNLCAISKDFSDIVKGYHGYIEAPLDAIYRPQLDAYGIYYIGIISDQSSLEVAAGPQATLFNNSRPFMGIQFINLPLGTQVNKLDLNTGKINDTDTTISYQEGTARVCCVLRHVLENGSPVVPIPDPTPEAGEEFTELVTGSIYWQQVVVDGITFTLSSDYGPVVQMEWNGSEDDWTGCEYTNAIQEYSDHSLSAIKYKFGTSEDGVYSTTITRADGDKVEIQLNISGSNFIGGSLIKLTRA